MANDDLFVVEDGGVETKTIKSVFKNPFNHLRTGISYMLPFIMLGGILRAIGVLTRVFPDASILVNIDLLGKTGMNFFVPFFGAYIAYSIADKPGLAPGFVCAYLANANGSGYLGALLSGFLVGYAIEVMNCYVKPSKMWEQIWGMFCPIIACAVVGLVVLGLLNGPISAFTNWAAGELSNLDSSKGALLGLILGALDGIDYGGPISKIASAIAGAAYSEGITTFYGCRISMVMVPPLGIMLATFLAPKLFTQGERQYAKTGWLLTLVGGYTELALPIVLNDIVRCTIASFCGSVVASTIAGYFGQTLAVPAMGLPSWFFVGNIPVYALSIVVGTAVTCSLVIILKKRRVSKGFNPEQA